MYLYDRYQAEKEKREKVREITQYEWEKLIERINELEERVGHSELAIERLEHSEDKEYLESIEHCNECKKLGINDKECRNYNNCKTKKFYEDIEKDLKERQSIYDDTCKRCSQFDTMTNECCVNANCRDEYLTPERPCKTCKWCKESLGEDICKNEKSKYWMLMVNKEEYTCENWEKKPKQNKKWIVHRTLRTKGIEVYISNIKDVYDTNIEYLVTYKCEDDFNGYGEDIFSCMNKDWAYRFNLSTALRLRDLLNKQREGKRYLWVVSEVKE